MSKRKLVLLTAVVAILVLGITIPAVAQLNTGNVQNAQGVVQSCSVADDIEFEGSSITLSPALESESSQTIEQAAAPD